MNRPRTSLVFAAIASAVLLVAACGTDRAVSEPDPVAQSSTVDPSSDGYDRSADTTIAKWGQPLTFTINEDGTTGYGEEHTGTVTAVREGTGIKVTTTATDGPIKHTALRFYAKVNGQMEQSTTDNDGGDYPDYVMPGESFTLTYEFSAKPEQVAVTDAATQRIGQWED